MAIPTFAFTTEVDDRVSYGLGLAPERITETVRKRLFVERGKFVGKSNGSGDRLGSFTRRVLSMRRRSRPGKMPIQVASMWRGLMSEPQKGSLNGMVMTMGILKNTTRPFVRGLLDLQDGVSRRSSKFMPIPVYENLAKAGITSKYSNAFKSMAGFGELNPIKLGGKILFVSQKMLEQGYDVHDATLFVGVKRITVRPMKFKFVEQWTSKWPGVQKRMGNAINKEIRDIEQGYRKAK